MGNTTSENCCLCEHSHAVLQLHETGQLPAVPLFYQAAKCAQLFEMPGAGGLFSVKGDGDRDFGFGFNLIVYYVGPGDAFPQLVWYNQVLAAHCIPLLSASRCSVHPAAQCILVCTLSHLVAPCLLSHQAGAAGKQGQPGQQQQGQQGEQGPQQQGQQQQWP